MIVVASASKPFLYTAKGTLRRQAIINDYELEINAAYAAVDASSQTDVSAPKEWNLMEVKGFLRAILGRIMRNDLENVEDDTDLFELGLDRCVHCRIRSLLSTLLSPLKASKLPSFVMPYSIPCANHTQKLSA